jgi:HEAT repeat protein
MKEELEKAINSFLSELAFSGKSKNTISSYSFHLAKFKDQLQRSPTILNLAKDERDKGDILYLLGLIGTPEIASKIEEAIKDEQPLIKEIAYEAIEKIKKRETFH